jgi:hypothetical protein
MFISMSPSTSASSVSAFSSAQAPISTASPVAAEVAAAAVAATDSQDNSGADLSDAAKVYSAQQMIAAVTDAVTADPVTPGSMVDELV